jgi:5-methylcytosine-specific restriction enzyme A
MGKLTKLPNVLQPLRSRLGYADDLAPERGRVRDRTQHWRAWYKTSRWQRLRWSVLVRDLFTCIECKRIEADTSQLVADHIQPHRGDAALFWDAGNLQCMCKACHDSVKQARDKAML